MQHPPATYLSIALLRGRQQIETVLGNLKDNLILINRYTRSLNGYFTQAIAALVTYCMQNMTKARIQ